MLLRFRTTRTVVVRISKDRVAMFLHVRQLENEIRNRRVDQVDIVNVSANVSELSNDGFGGVGISATKTIKKHRPHATRAVHQITPRDDRRIRSDVPSHGRQRRHPRRIPPPGCGVSCELRFPHVFHHVIAELMGEEIACPHDAQCDVSSADGRGWFDFESEADAAVEDGFEEGKGVDVGGCDLVLLLWLLLLLLLLLPNQW
mmetsp:Transcript_4119/g.8521  ORF Transcript_4119/g.8521 Transcript_4119/m.8521 type:complete len:202 (+) Transcript_4119:1660-2265(+)